MGFSKQEYRSGLPFPSPKDLSNPGIEPGSPVWQEMLVGRCFYHLSRRCIKSLIAVFQKHAGRDGNNSKLSKAESLIFMNTELGAFTKNPKDCGVLDHMMKKLDLNSDGQLDFQEFLNLIGGLVIACHESFLKSVSCQK